jgi:hypothetical protein
MVYCHHCRNDFPRYIYASENGERAAEVKREAKRELRNEQKMLKLDCTPGTTDLAADLCHICMQGILCVTDNTLEVKCTDCDRYFRRFDVGTKERNPGHFRLSSGTTPVKKQEQLYFGEGEDPGDISYEEYLSIRYKSSVPVYSGYASSSHSYWEESDEVFVRNVNRKFFPPFLKPPVEIQLDGTPKPWGEEELKSEQSISLKAYA